MNLSNLSALFKSIGDPNRLRLLHLLSIEELTVGELVKILEWPQSTVSRQLKPLKERGLVSERPHGAATYYRASLEADRGANGDTELRDALHGLLESMPLPPADRTRLDRIVALREAEGPEFFDRIGLRWDALRENCFGPTFHLEAFVHLLPREWTVADLGTGTGYLLSPLALHFKRVIGVDASRPMLELAARHARELKLDNIDLRHGELEQLPIKKGEIDLGVCILMLHHIAEIGAVLSGIHRALKQGGRVLIVEFHPHENEKFRAAMADRRYGIDAGELAGWLNRTGFEVSDTWDFPHVEHPEHELAPLPRLYGIVAGKQS